MRLDTSSPVTMDRVQQTFETLAADEAWSPSKRNNRWSYLRRAIEAALAAVAATSDDLRPALSILPKFAPPPDGASSVRKTLSLLLGQPVTHKQRGYRLDEVRWSPLISVTRRRGGGRTHYANLELVLRVANSWDTAPRVMPSMPALKAAAQSIEMPKPTLRAAVATYRQAREALRELDSAAAAAFGPIAKPHPRCIGIETVPHDILVPLLRAAGVEDHPEDLSTARLIQAAAPVLYEEWQAWKKAPRRGERDGLVTRLGEYQTDRAVSRLAAGLLLAGRAELLARLSLLNLWTPTEPPFDGARAMDPITIRARVYMGKAHDPVLHPPVRVAMDVTAARSREIAGATDGDYTTSAVVNLQRLWMLTGGVYRERFLEDDPRSWDDLERQYKAAYSYCSAHEAEPAAVRDKAKLLELVSLPQFVCVGFPLLEMARVHARQQWLDVVARARAAGHDPEEVPAVRQAHAAYAEAAEMRLMPGIYVADGLRLSNYRFGLLGKHYHVILTYDSAGRPNGIAAITTEWSGAYRDVARTKRDVDSKRRTSGRRSRIAQRRMPPWAHAHVPLDALWEYLNEVTLPRAIAAGLVGHAASVEELIATKQVPIVLSRKCRPGHLVSPSGTTLGVERVGRALWWTARFALGRELPDWDDLDRSDEYFRIFVGHDVRLLGSCFWGKVMDDWGYASWLTNDREQTLKDFYSADAYNRWAQAGGNRSHWDHPKAYARVMKRIREDASFVPTLLQPAVPLPAATAKLLDQWQRRDRDASRRNRRRAGGGTGIRRARPGQRPPVRVANGHSWVAATT